MIPSANSAGDLSTWHTENWAVHHGGAAASVGTAYNTSISSSGAGPPEGDHSRYLTLHRHQVLDWENAMLLAQHSNGSTPNNGHDSVYDQVAGYHKAADGITSMQAEAIASLSHPRQYEELLSAHMASSNSAGSFANSVNAWGLLNTVCSRSSGSTLQQEASLLQTEGSPYGYHESINGADALGAYSSLAGAGAAAGLYADSLRPSGNSNIGLTTFDQRRLDDIMKRELYTTHDLNSRLGLNLGGRTYFSADDFAFGRWGKRLRPNSPGCVMQPAPLCQAEGCKADLSMAKHYHRRHKVCEYHSKAATVHIGEQTQRFCQQCSRFHVLDEFDDGKRSCRKRLADHNRRRRKPQPTPATQLVADAADTPRAETNGGGTDRQEAKELLHLQESTNCTGIDSGALQTGAMCNKGSPLPSSAAQLADGKNGADPTTSCAASFVASNMINSMEGNSIQLKMIEHEADQTHDNSQQSKAAMLTSTSSSSMKNDLLTAAGSNNHRSSITTHGMSLASPGTPAGSCHLAAASLSLGGATDMILDVKQETGHVQQKLNIDAHGDGAAAGPNFDQGSVSASKAALVMPWLQQVGPKNNQNMQGSPRVEHTGSAGGEDGAHIPEFDAERAVRMKSDNIGKDKNNTSSNRGSWMLDMKVMESANEAASTTAVGRQHQDSVLLMNSRYASCGSIAKSGNSSSDGEGAAGAGGGGGRHELLRLLGDERDQLLLSMASSNFKGGAGRGTSSNTTGTLTFLDHPSSGFAARPEQQQQLLHFSSDQAGATMSLINPAGPSSSTLIFHDSHNHTRMH